MLLVHSVGLKTRSAPLNQRCAFGRRIEESMMFDPLSQYDEFEGYPTGRVLILAALFAAALYLSRSGSDASSREWGYLLFGGVMLGLTIMDAKTGWAIVFYRPVNRSKEPTLYWTSIAISSALGLAAVVFSVGALLGYSSL